MTQITASMVSELRTLTGAGMMDCKKALTECAGDLESAQDWLRKKGLSAAAKKSSRVAAEGLVAVAAAGNVGVAVEVNAETDFVARNEHFQAFVKKVANLALGAAVSDVEALKNSAYGNGKSVQEELTSLIATIGENMNLRRLTKISVDQGCIASYVHNAVAEGLGKIGVLVAIGSAAGEKASSLAKQLCLHVAAANPLSLDVHSLDPAVVEKERSIFAEQARTSGKPENIIEKMVEGRISKFYQESVLLEQVFVMDGETKIKDLLIKSAKDLGSDLSLTSFVRMQLGEGIEKQESNFAEEVAATLKA